MQVPSLLGRAIVSSTAFGLLGLPAETFLRFMPIKVRVGPLVLLAHLTLAAGTQAMPNAQVAGAA